MTTAIETTPAAERAQFGRQRLFVLTVLFGLYLCANLVLRWLRYPLFFGSDAYGWPSPTPLARLYEIGMACLPVLLWAVVAQALVCRFPSVIKPWLYGVAFLLLLVLIELDMRWYTMSHRHGDFDQLRLLLANPGGMGLTMLDVRHFAAIVAFHALAVGSLVLMSGFAARRMARSGLLPRPRRGLTGAALGAVVVLVLADGAVVGHKRAEDLGEVYHSQWEELARANPIRPAWPDTLWRGASARQRDLNQANAAAGQYQSPPGAMEASLVMAPATRPVAGRPNVVVLVIESLNKRLMDLANAPNYRKLRAQSIDLDNHFTTGNCTQYGVLGLLYGEPVTFFGNSTPRGSPFIERFERSGYQTRKLTSCRELSPMQDAYEGHLTQPTFASKGDWALVPAVREELAKPGPRLVFVYYWRTHYPYVHRAEYRAHEPEVSGNFDYSRSNVRDYREPITNRYLNCLDELDDWLGAVLKSIDLKNTILVFTGDHGEEFFEKGRLSHCSSLDDPQIRVPMLMHIPGVSPRRLEIITSHADVMPTIADVLGWEDVPARGRSIFQAGPRSAWVAMDNHERAAQTWAIITPQGRMIVRASGSRPEIQSLQDSRERPVLYRDDPSRWTDSLEQSWQLVEALHPRRAVVREAAR